MPRPHKPSIYEIELQRKIDTLQIKLLQLNATLRLKVTYCERLECLVQQRNARVDQLYSLLERARRQNILLDEENERLATMIANENRPQAQIEAP